jgi:hypothetical protein
VKVKIREVEEGGNEEGITGCERMIPTRHFPPKTAKDVQDTPLPQSRNLASHFWLGCRPLPNVSNTCTILKQHLNNIFVFIPLRQTHRTGRPICFLHTTDSLHGADALRWHQRDHRGGSIAASLWYVSNLSKKTERHVG